MLDISGELAALGYQFDYANGKIKVRCPFHDDENPSCLIDPKENRFTCWASDCRATGDLILLLSKIRNEPVKDTRRYVQQKYGISFDKTISPLLIEDCHKEIWNHSDLLKELHKRAVTDELIAKYRLGYQNGRITIPIPNSAGFYCGLRLYSPGAEINKFQSMRGYSGNFIFPYEQLQYSKIMITAGEIKSIVAANQLNPSGIGAVSCIHGEGVLSHELIKSLKDKEIIYVCQDIDTAGRDAAKKICHLLSNSVGNIFDVLLPLDIDQFPKGDLNDFVFNNGQLVDLLNSLSPWEPESNELVDETPKDSTLQAAFSAKYSGHRLNYSGIISCIGESVYHVPKTVCISCTKDVEGSCNICSNVFPSKDGLFQIHPESIAILATVGASATAQHNAIGEALSIPTTCKVWTHDSNERYAVEDIRISPELQITNRDTERTMQPAILIRNEDSREAVYLNETYSFTGRTWPNPKNQEAVSVISDYKLVKSALETYICQDTEKLQVFQPLKWTVESLKEKLNHIYADLESNIVRIYKRREIYLTVDLTYHSMLFLTFDNHEEKGIVETLIIGDPSQGKSKVPERLMEHYRLGERLDCANASKAGIIGGLQQFGSNGKWFVTWGIIPTHDRRLVILDEVGESKFDLLGEMNDMRSSGIAQITKIRQMRTKARTRLIFISNPKVSRTLSSYNHGVEAIIDLCGNTQYLRRFDLACLVEKSEVDIDSLQTHRPEIEHVYTSDLCNELVLWCWTRNKIQFENEKLVLELAAQLTDKFIEDIPLVDKGSMRLKLARLAAACAGRTYSESGGELYVRDCHVRFVAEFLFNMYSKVTFGYLDYSKNIRDLESLRNPNHVLKMLNALPFPRDFVEGAIRSNNIDIQHVLDTSGLDRQAAQALMSFLCRNRAVKRSGRNYYKTSQFTEHLKKWASNGCLIDKPEHLGQGEF